MAETFQVPKVAPPSLPSPSSLVFSSTNKSLAPELSAIPTSATGIASSVGVATSAAGLTNKVGIPTSLPPLDASLNTLAGGAGLPDLSLKGISGMSGINIPSFNFPKIPAFPGSDLPGLLLGKSPKFIAETLSKYQTLAPPFIPGLKMNMGMAMAAVSVIKAAASSSPGELVKHMIEGMINDVKQEVASKIQESINTTTGNLQSSVQGVLSGAQSSAENAWKIENPAETIIDENGVETIVEKPMPDFSENTRKLSDIFSSTNSSTPSGNAVDKIVPQTSPNE